MNKVECVNTLLNWFPEKKDMYGEHMNDFGELLLHVFSTDAIHEPLIRLLEINKDDKLIQRYCDFVELMWRDGDDDVVNVVDVTILERLSDAPEVWQRFGKHISGEFIKYINEDVLKTNAMMFHAAPLIEIFSGIKKEK